MPTTRRFFPEVEKSRRSAISQNEDFLNPKLFPIKQRACGERYNFPEMFTPPFKEHGKYSFTGQ